MLKRAFQIHNFKQKRKNLMRDSSDNENNIIIKFLYIVKKMKFMETLRFRWYGPYRLDDAIDFREGSDYGLYAITRIWGNFPERLLYIGMTYWQDFGKRLSQHYRDWLGDARGVRVRFGYLMLQPGQRMSYARIRDAENLLIWCLEPPENTQGVRTYSGRNLRVINSGARGPIPRKVDIHCWE